MRIIEHSVYVLLKLGWELMIFGGARKYVGNIFKRANCNISNWSKKIHFLNNA